jgi:hypothetical protein
MRRFGKVAAGAKGSLVSMGTGGAIGFASGYALSAVPFLGQAWWTMPIALAAVGHFLKRKNPTVGGALLGVAGYWGYTGFMASRASVSAKGFIDAGFIDAGRYMPGGSDAGALSYNDNIGTDASPAMGTAQAAMLLSPGGNNAMGIDDSAELLEAYGLQD